MAAKALARRSTPCSQSEPKPRNALGQFLAQTPTKARANTKKAVARSTPPRSTKAPAKAKVAIEYREKDRAVRVSASAKPSQRGMDRGFVQFLTRVGTGLGVGLSLVGAGYGIAKVVSATREPSTR